MSLSPAGEGQVREAEERRKRLIKARNLIMAMGGPPTVYLTTTFATMSTSYTAKKDEDLITRGQLRGILGL